MTRPAAAQPGTDWEALGRNLGETLEGYSSLVVVGGDPDATARVAIGMGRVQAEKRRVALGDLIGDAPPLQALVASDDPHGLVDSFRYGVSLNRIAHRVEGVGNLFIMPSGSEGPDYDEILPNPRWRRLAAGFREAGALLLLVVPADAPHVGELVDSLGGAVLVGDRVPPTLPLAAVVTTVREPRGPAPPLERPFIPIAAPVPERRWWPAAVGVGIAVVLAVVALWLADRPLARNAQSPSGRRVVKPNTVTGATAKLLDSSDSARRAVGKSDSAGGAAATAAPLKAANPGDSAGAAAFAVELLAANTQAGAILKLQQDGKNLPAATFAPVLSRGERWFRVFAGAYTNRATADSLLVELRRRGVIEARGGSVAQVPLAFLVDSAIPSAAVPNVVANYADRGQPVYALRQRDGSAWLLVGAFEKPEQATLYAESLRAAGITPVLVYRKGRLF